MKTKPIQKLLAAALSCALTSAATAAYADDMSATPSADTSVTETTLGVAPDADAWQFGANVPLWAVQVNGNATVLGHQQNVNVSFQTLRDHLDASFGLGLSASKGKFGIYGNFGYMKFSGTFPGPLGGTTSADLKFVLANAGVSYLLVKTDNEHPFVLAGTAGVRYWYTDTTLSHVDKSGTRDWNGGKSRNIEDPVIGLRASQYLTQKLHLDVSGDGGGFDINNDTDWTWSATGVLTYDFWKWFSLSAGYQAVALDEAKGSGASKNGVNLIFNGALVALNFKW